MAQVTVEINGSKYQIACDDGQEAHLKRLGDYIGNRVQELSAAVGQVGDVEVMVAIAHLAPAPWLYLRPLPHWPLATVRGPRPGRLLRSGNSEHILPPRRHSF